MNETLSALEFTAAAVWGEKPDAYRERYANLQGRPAVLFAARRHAGYTAADVARYYELSERQVRRHCDGVAGLLDLYLRHNDKAANRNRPPLVEFLCLLGFDFAMYQVRRRVAQMRLEPCHAQSLRRFPQFRHSLEAIGLELIIRPLR